MAIDKTKGKDPTVKQIIVQIISIYSRYILFWFCCKVKKQCWNVKQITQIMIKSNGIVAKYFTILEELQLITWSMVPDLTKNRVKSYLF